METIYNGKTVSQMNPGEMKAYIKHLEEQRAATASMPLKFKVSDKGAVSVYGLQRFPVTLYVEQWTRLLQTVPQLEAFLKENVSKLKLKGEAPREATATVA